MVPRGAKWGPICTQWELFGTSPGPLWDPFGASSARLGLVWAPMGGPSPSQEVPDAVLGVVCVAPRESNIQRKIVMFCMEFATGEKLEKNRFIQTCFFSSFRPVAGITQKRNNFCMFLPSQRRSATTPSAVSGLLCGTPGPAWGPLWGPRESKRPQRSAEGGPKGPKRAPRGTQEPRGAPKDKVD